MELMMNMNYAIEPHSMYPSHNGLVSPPSLSLSSSSSLSSWSTSSASSVSSLSSLNSVVRFNISRGFEPEDDMEFCPALSCGRGVDGNQHQYQLLLRQQQMQQQIQQNPQTMQNYGDAMSPTSYNVNPYQYSSKSSYSISSPSASTADGSGLMSPRNSPGAESSIADSATPLIDSNGFGALPPSSPGTPTGRTARIRRAIEIVDPSTGLKIQAK